ncbi:MAG: hypothetical protein WEA36_07060 [Balneolaceae bacterium]
MGKHFFFILIGIITSYSCTPNDEFDSLFSIDIPDQNIDRREYLTLNKPSKVFLFSELINPQRLLVSNNSIITFDYGNEYNALRLDWNFNRLNSIDFSSGQGPSEIGQLTDVEVIADTLYLADATNALIHTYDIQGNFIRSLSIDEKIPHRIVSSGNTKLFVSTPLTSSDGIESMYSLDGRLLHNAERVSTDDLRYRILLESEFASNPDFVFRAPQFFGVLIAYDNSGAVVSAKKTIDGFFTPFDNRNTDSSEQPPMFNRNELGMATLRVKATNDLVCTLIIKQVGDPEMERVTDCYKSENLEYLFSLETPNGTQDFGLFDNNFITLQDTTVTVIEFLQE